MSSSSSATATEHYRFGHDPCRRRSWTSRRTLGDGGSVGHLLEWDEPDDVASHAIEFLS
jgi:hypothetical protein